MNVGTAAADGSGDLEAELRRVSDITGVPISSARANPDAVRRRAAAESIDLDFVQRFPSTTSFLADQNNAAIAYDDIDALTRVEGALGAVAKYVASAEDGRGAGPAAKAGYHAASSSVAGAFRGLSEVAAPLLDFLEPVESIGGNPLRRVAEGFNMIAQAQGRAALTSLLPPRNWFEAGVNSGIQSLVSNAIALPLALAPGGQGAALAMMSTQQGGTSYQKAREAGHSVGTSAIYGASDAVIEWATEMVPVAGLFGRLARRAA